MLQDLLLKLHLRQFDRPGCGRLHSAVIVLSRSWAFNTRFILSGYTFTAEDGCNTCFCSKSPSSGNMYIAGCTLKACPKPLDMDLKASPEDECYANGVQYYDGM